MDCWLHLSPTGDALCECVGATLHTPCHVTREFRSQRREDAEGLDPDFFAFLFRDGAGGDGAPTCGRLPSWEMDSYVALSSCLGGRTPILFEGQ
jgi:hypothetical protein